MAKARDVPLDPGMPFAEAARITVGVRADELFEHAAGVLDTAAIEHVHATRVASRRLRAVLETFGVCFDADLHRGVLREVRALAEALAARRDPDVQLLAAAAPHAGAFRGLETMAVYLRARRALLFDRFGDAWTELGRQGFRARLEFALAERPTPITSPSHPGNGTGPVEDVPSPGMSA